MTLRILAIDDRDPGEITRSLKASSNHDIFAPDKGELKDILDSLFKAAGAAFDGNLTYINTDRFNDFDVLFLDFGLTTLDGFQLRLTAEHIAGYIRALTNIPYVVSLNKLGDVDFDLKYLLGDFDTRADLALNTKLLSIPGLWSGETETGKFCPWYWPRLDQVPARRKAQIEFIKDHLDRPILESLNFPEDVVQQLSSQAIAFLSPDADESESREKGNVRDVTFWQHFRSSNRTLIRDDRRGLFGGPDADIPLTPPNDDAIRTIAARVIAGELDYWFRRDILGPQRLLIDAPHLQAKYRFRPGEGEHPKADAWTATAKEFKPNFGLADDFYNAIKDFEFKQTYSQVDLIWTDKPSFWLPLIEDSEKFDELATSYPIRHNSLVFCEDTRQFIDRKSASIGSFETSLGRGIDVRYIKKLNDFQYSPQSYLAR